MKNVTSAGGESEPQEDGGTGHVENELISEVNPPLEKLFAEEIVADVPIECCGCRA